MTESKTDNRVVDKVLLEILRNRFQAIADEMASVAYRTAHTVFVKETQDFATALRAEGYLQGDVDMKKYYTTKFQPK
jgi:hypothetical protein